ncbi:hypothetical protein [Bacillus sp. P14.5]|uniref:hypothetical protein n=1 Tax=Bacillus sp. P14.5 TaxID=1983400 RepID=UPI001963205D|nr:hypothetical protein [Bacillus sp. P14.5]
MNRWNPTYAQISLIDYGKLVKVSYPDRNPRIHRRISEKDAFAWGISYYFA